MCAVDSALWMTLNVKKVLGSEQALESLKTQTIATPLIKFGGYGIEKAKLTLRRS